MRICRLVLADSYTLFAHIGIFADRLVDFTNIMRILVIGDSNCRGLSADFLSLVPDIQVKIVSVSRETSLVRAEYQRQLVT